MVADSAGVREPSAGDTGHAFARTGAVHVDAVATHGIVDPDDVGPAIAFLRVPEATTAKNRMHSDVRVAGEPPWDMTERGRRIREKVIALVAAGATVVREQRNGQDLGHVVLLDPEGNEFCVA